MKYGQTLHQRSIPEWSHYNVDYDDIKRMIKKHTTPGSGQAVSIPGQGGEIEKNFEDALYSILLEQHQRIDLFVRSKTGEIQRRLDHLTSQIKQSNNYLLAARTTKVTAKRLERYSRLENSVLRAGNDIRSLSRFTGAQRLAFSKLLKKYKKWTQSETLENRFNADLNKSGSFSNIDLGILLGRWAGALQDVRAPFQSGFLGHNPDRIDVNSFIPDSLPPRLSTSRIRNETAESHQLEFEIASNVDFDAGFDTTLGDVRGKVASYWVHNDSVVELQVLLLQYMRLFSSNSDSPISRSPSTQFQSRSMNASEPQSPFDRQDELNVIILEDLDYFIMEQNRRGFSENAPNLARLSVRYSSSNEAVVSLQPKPDCQVNDFVSSKVKVKHLGSLLDAQTPFRRSSSASKITASRTSDDNEASDDVIREWINQHAEVKPLVGICSKRTRFNALGQSRSQSLRAVLDRDVSMTNMKPEDLSNSDSVLNLRRASQHFPHAVLQVRQLDERADDLLRKLDQSHLVERIHGFSIEAHAVWCCCKPSNMEQPQWIPRLGQDIRKIPAVNEETRRKSNPPTNSANGVTKASISTPSASGQEPLDSSDTAVSLSKAGPSRAVARLKEAAANGYRKQNWRNFGKSKQSTGDPDKKYWNEYDDPEEGNDDAYVIWVDPNSGTSFKKWFGKLVPSWHHPSSPENTSLLSTGNNSIEDGLPNESSSTSDESPTEPRKAGSYGTFNPFHARARVAPSPRTNLLNGVFPHRGNKRAMSAPHSRSRSRLLNSHAHASGHVALESDSTALERYERTRTLLIFLTFSASSAILAVICILAGTGRHKQAYEVDAGIVFGIVVNLLFACIGLGCLVSGRGTSWVGWCCGLALFGAICVGNGGLCAWLVT